MSDERAKQLRRRNLITGCVLALVALLIMLSVGYARLSS